MNITSNWLGQLARSIGLSSPGLYESELVIPGSIQSVISPMAPMEDIPGATSPFKSSFCHSSFATVANAAALQTTVCTITAGYWDLSLWIGYISNFISVGEAANVNIQRQDLASPSEIAGFIATGTAAVPNQISPSQIRINVLVTVPLVIVSNLIINGATQSHSIVCNVMGNRLL